MKQSFMRAVCFAELPDKLLRSFLLSFALAACSINTSLTNEASFWEAPYPSLPLSYLPSLEVPDEPLTAPYKLSVALQKIEDQRQEKAIFEYQGKVVREQGDMGLPVHYVLQTGLEDRGFVVSDSAPVSIHVAVTSWRAQLIDGKLAAEAVLIGNVLSPGGKTIYSGVYEGASTAAESDITPAAVQEVLGSAMHRALTKIVSDKKFIDVLSSF